MQQLPTHIENYSTISISWHTMRNHIVGCNNNSNNNNICSIKIDFNSNWSKASKKYRETTNDVIVAVKCELKASFLFVDAFHFLLAYRSCNCVEVNLVSLLQSIFIYWLIDCLQRIAAVLWKLVWLLHLPLHRHDMPSIPLFSLMALFLALLSFLSLFSLCSLSIFFLLSLSLSLIPYISIIFHLATSFYRSLSHFIN